MREITKEDIALLGDQEWRLNNLYYIRPKNAARCVFKPNWAQRTIRETKNRQRFRRACIPKGRQFGVSTGEVMFALDDVLFRKNGNIAAGIIDITLDQGKDKIAMAKFAYDSLVAPWHEYQHLGELIHAGRKLVSDNTTTLRWDNGSSMHTAMSFVGKTLKRLHVSDAGKIAYADPQRSGEIIESFESVPKDCDILCEGVHYGGKSGWFYNTCREALNTPQEGHVDPTQWRMIFLEWWKHPEYSLDGAAKFDLDEDMVVYFEGLEKNHGIKCTIGQKLWYQTRCKSAGGRNAVYGQYPSTLAEAWNAPVEGAIYGDLITSLRSKGRVKDFTPHRDLPIFTFWDIGHFDETAIWLVQPATQEVLWIDWLAESGQAASHYADRMREWERKYDRQISCHFLPHDGARKNFASGTSAVEGLIRAGIPTHSIQVVPRASDVWEGINRLRELIPRSVFHVECDRARMVRGDEVPSGLNRLESYHKKVTEFANTQHEKPVHDGSSHMADAARTFAEAEIKGMLTGGAWTWHDGRDVRKRRKTAIKGPSFLRR